MLLFYFYKKFRFLFFCLKDILYIYQEFKNYIMKITIENVIVPSELHAINTIISMIPNGSLEETYNFITTERNQKFRLKKAGIKTGMGSNHIWISNWRGNRILLITED